MTSLMLYLHEDSAALRQILFCLTPTFEKVIVGKKIDEFVLRFCLKNNMKIRLKIKCKNVADQ